MPQSITIAFFVLGAVLLLIAILQGGGFKIFGAEVDGSPGRFGRVFAGLLGVILIGIGLVTSLDSPYFNPPRAVERPLRMSPNRVSQAPRILAKRKKSRAVRPGRERPLSTNRNLCKPLTSLGRGTTRNGDEFQISQQGNAFTIRITGMYLQRNQQRTIARARLASMKREAEGNGKVPS